MRLTYSIADQRWPAKSMGIFNISMGLAGALARHVRVGRLTVLANSSIPGDAWKGERSNTIVHDRPVGSRLGRLWWDHVGCYGAAARTGNAWLVLPKGFASGLRRCPLRLAVYMHDIIELVYPERYPGYCSRSRHRYFPWIYRRTHAH